MEIQKTETGVSLIQGTTGTFSFAIFARSGHYALTIRPIPQMGNSTHFGFRVRAVPLPVEGVALLGADDEDSSTSADAIRAAFTGLNFGKTSGVRASLVGAIECVYGQHHIQKAIDWYGTNDVANKILAGILEAVENKDCTKVLEFDKVVDWLKEQHLAPLKTVLEAQEAPIEPLEGGGVVLSFNAPVAGVGHDDDDGDDAPSGLHLNSDKVGGPVSEVDADLAKEAAELQELAGTEGAEEPKS